MRRAITPRDTIIAGNLTAADWQATRDNLPGAGAEVWRKAFKDWFMQRLELRYLGPIKTLRATKNNNGEGFSIVAIQCTLIEFLAAIRVGKNYRYVRKGDPALDKKTEYKDSKDLFTSFLSGVNPFSTWFDTESALGFYEGIRCGLLHEASTKQGWTIWASGTAPIDAHFRIVDRDAMQELILDYIAGYGEELESNRALQAGFIRKFDALAGL